MRALPLLLMLGACDAGPHIHVITELSASEGQADFLLPNATVETVDAASLVGKPYLVSVFEGGFSQGNDDPLEIAWGLVPDDLVISFSTEGSFEPGPYDASVIVYVNTPVDPADMEPGAEFDPVPPVGGDLSAFSLDDGEVLEGDPTFEAGVVRINVIDGEGDATKHLANRTAAPDDSEGLFAAFTNTILLVP
ncbi:MAG: hypothetical protein EP330_26490 [Deltaproteobacteria bacterium]|nr:MAG: hypothetical protein EP330_26490 [Deltaproteobacteria bacterium]